MDIVTGLLMGAINGGGGSGSGGSVASVVVDFRQTLVNSVYNSVGYGKFNSDLNGVSIETAPMEYFVDNTNKIARYYIPVCLPQNGDDLEPYYLLPGGVLEFFTVTITGGASVYDGVCRVRDSASSWSSVLLDGIKITGDAEIVFVPKE